MTTATNTRTALVVGLGVSGIATALRLRRAGWTPVIIEKAPERRTGGYFVAMFGTGRNAAERLGILDSLADHTPHLANLDIDRHGRAVPGLAYRDLPGAPWQMMRGDVESAAYQALPDDVEIRFSTVPVRIGQDIDGVDVELQHLRTGTTTVERFDLVVGADGLRSTTRALTFGPHERYIHRLDHMVVAFEHPGTLPGLQPNEGATLIEEGRSMWVYALDNRNPTVMFTYRTDDVDAEFTGRPVDRVREVFGPEPLGRTLGAAIDAMENAQNVLFDSVEQVKMPRWSLGRVALVGDAAWCVTPWAGMGVSAGITGATLLGDALDRHPDDITRALTEWENTFRPSIAFYQKHAVDQRSFFVPADRKEIAVRAVFGKMMSRRALGWLVHQLPALRESSTKLNIDIELPPVDDERHDRPTRRADTRERVLAA